MKKLFCFVLVILMLLPLIIQAFGSEPALRREVTILFTHDLHSNLLPFKQMNGEQAQQIGGFARLKTLIDRQSENKDVLLVDGGDFAMGTLFQTIFTASAPELRLLGAMGYDAVTLGNHEFDFGMQGITEMLKTAQESGEELPQLLFNAGELEFLETQNPQNAREEFASALYGVGAQQTTIIEKNGVKIGIFSAFGEDSVLFSPLMDLEIPSITENAKAAVAELKAQGAELIVCLSHSGTKDDPKLSEDELLAKAVPEIDVIISGHTHTYLPEPIVVGNTIIASAESYSKYLGQIELVETNGGWELKSYQLIPVTIDIEPNAEIEAKIEDFKKQVEEDYLAKSGDLAFDTAVAYVPYSTLKFDVYEKHGESLLGNLIADAYLAASAGLEVPVDLSVAPAGLIRWEIPKGEVTLADVFNVDSLGIGGDKTSGYPLIDIYVTGAELKNVAEVDASITALMPEAQLFFSGLNYTFNPNCLIFNKVTDIYITGENGTRIEIEDDKLYHAVCSLYSAQMLGSVEGKSKGIISITPKDENGLPITDFYSRIIYNQSGGEVKAWYAIAQYMGSFPEGENGASVLPQYYSEYHGRKVVDTTTSPAIYFTHLNAFALKLYFAVFAILVIFGIIIYRAAKRSKAKKLKKV